MKKDVDNTEKIIRIGCGGMLGLVIGFFVGVRLFLIHGRDNFTAVIILTILLTLLFGFLSFKNGDDFWDSVVDKFKRWF